jgi:hypothetical protein
MKIVLKHNIIYWIALIFIIGGCVHLVSKNLKESSRLTKFDLSYEWLSSTTKVDLESAQSILVIEIATASDRSAHAPLVMLTQNSSIQYLQIEIPRCDSLVLDNLSSLVNSVMQSQSEKRDFILATVGRASECVSRILASTWARKARALLIREPSGLLFSLEDQDRLTKRTLVISHSDVDKVPGAEGFHQGLAARNIDSKFLNFADVPEFDATVQDFLGLSSKQR